MNFCSDLLSWAKLLKNEFWSLLLHWAKMWQITTLTEFAIESKSIQKFIFDRFCPFGQKPDKCQFCYQVWHPCKCLDKVKVILVFTHGANLRQMRHLPPLRHEAKLSKIKQMWHLQMVCSKFAIEVNPFFRPVFTIFWSLIFCISLTAAPKMLLLRSRITLSYYLDFATVIFTDPFLQTYVVRRAVTNRLSRRVTGR